MVSAHTDIMCLKTCKRQTDVHDTNLNPHVDTVDKINLNIYMTCWFPLLVSIMPWGQYIYSRPILPSEDTPITNNDLFICLFFVAKPLNVLARMTKRKKSHVTSQGYERLQYKYDLYFN